MEHVNLFKHFVLIPYLVTICTLTFAGVCGGDDSSVSKPFKLHKPIFVEKQLTDEEQVVGDQLENMEQCAGTIRHYRFPPSGYEPVKENSRTRRGKALYDKNNCAQCHSIGGKGEQLGPPLDGIGGHRGQEWLTARLLDPEKQMLDFPEVFDRRKNIMPHPGIDRQDAELVAEFLLTLPEPDFGWLVTAHEGAAHSTGPSHFEYRAQDESSRRGAKLFVQLYCASCHTTDGAGNRSGPDLRGVGARLSESELDEILRGSAKSFTMRAITTSIDEDELKDLKAFLLSLPK